MTFCFFPDIKNSLYIGRLLDAPKKLFILILALCIASFLSCLTNHQAATPAPLIPPLPLADADSQLRTYLLACGKTDETGLAQTQYLMRFAADASGDHDGIVSPAEAAAFLAALDPPGSDQWVVVPIGTTGDTKHINVSELRRITGLVRLPGGSFTMGLTAAEETELLRSLNVESYQEILSHKPPRPVAVQAFEMTSTEMTMYEQRLLMG